MICADGESHCGNRFDRKRATADPMNASALPSWRQLGHLDWSWETCLAHELQELQFLIVCHRSKKVLVKLEEGRWVLPGRCYPYDDFSSAFNTRSAKNHRFHDSTDSCAAGVEKNENGFDEGFFGYYGKSVILMACDDDCTGEHIVTPQQAWLHVDACSRSKCFAFD